MTTMESVTVTLNPVPRGDISTLKCRLRFIKHLEQMSGPLSCIRQAVSSWNRLTWWTSLLSRFHAPFAGHPLNEFSCNRLTWWPWSGCCWRVSSVRFLRKLSLCEAGSCVSCSKVPLSSNSGVSLWMSASKSWGRWGNSICVRITSISGRMICAKCITLVVFA